MKTEKLHAGATFPALNVANNDNDIVNISQPPGDNDWQMVVVYRGRHCPLCTRYLNTLSDYRDRLSTIGIDVAAVSADSRDQLDEHRDRLIVNYPLYHGLDMQQMQSLGLYISVPRSEQETDHNFAEPGLFVINADGALQVVDISNNPFVRPDLESLVSGLEWIRNPDNHYPIRGTWR